MTEQKSIQEYQDDKSRLYSELAHADEQIDAILGQRPVFTAPTIRVRYNIKDSNAGVRTVETTCEITGDPAVLTPEHCADITREFRAAIDLVYVPPPLTDKAVLAILGPTLQAVADHTDGQINPEDLGPA